MSDAKLVVSMLSLVVSDIDESLRFFHLLGVEIPTPPGDYPPGSGAFHASMETGAGLTFDLDNVPMAKVYANDDIAAGVAIIGVGLPSREAVDAKFAELTAAGYASVRSPWDAFWGSRYAIVQGPDGYHVGLMSPSS
jgi:uncharacterized glyoxalase superfamily protein PhnB